MAPLTLELTRMTNSPVRYLALGWLIVLTGCVTSRPVQVAPAVWAAPTDGAVACVDRHAAEVGAQVLADGGNAVDAAIASALALAVTFPPAGNIGGGCVLVARFADGAATSIDARETAPLAASPSMFLDEHGLYDPDSALHPWLCTGTPGTLRGLEYAHRHYGSLPWRRLVEPAARLAEEGFVVSANLAAWLAACERELAAIPTSAAIFLDDAGHALRPGALLVQEDLARTLKQIATFGADVFYEGPLGDEFVSAIQQGGGLMSREDLALYEAVEREPIRFAFAGHDVISMPPPSSGGVALAQMTGMLEMFGATRTPLDDVDSLHMRAEAARRAFADRARWLADPDHVSVPVDDLLAPEHLMDLALSAQPDSASQSASFGPPIELPEGNDTTHLSVVDGQGNAVSITITLEAMMGSKAVAGSTGILLNNELRDFNRIPGTTTTTGHIGTFPNIAGPRKRPLTSMTPTIVAEPAHDDGTAGRVVLVTGSPGGRTIINTVFQMVLRVVAQDMPLDAAVAGARMHHSWWPDEVSLEANRFDAATIAALRQRGHRVVELDVAANPLRGTLGAAHSIAFDAATGQLHAVGDARRDGWAAAPTTGP